MEQTTAITCPRAFFRTIKMLCLAWIVALAVACTPRPTPAVVASLGEIQTDISRGGRMVAVSVSANTRGLAIAASESGGLFRTTDGGSTWQHIDAFLPFRMVDVAFAELGSPDPLVVFATTIKDAQTNPSANYGGIWRSRDEGLNWTHLVPEDRCPAPQNAHGIALYGFAGIFVAADCGLLHSPDLGNTWVNRLAQPVRAVTAQVIGGKLYIDVCLQGGGHRRSTDIGNTWSPVHRGPTCETGHSLAASPLESNVLFATAGKTLLESDDGGQTWTTDLRATAYNERPVWVQTRPAIDRDPTHFDLYFPGRRVTCTNNSAGPRCPSNAGETWARVPDSPLNHNINGLAFDPLNNCPLMMAADFGVYKMGNPTTASPCGTDAAWTHVGRASNGLGSLQIYQVSGQLHYPIHGDVELSGYTNLFIGTMDNWLWAAHDAGPIGWKGFGITGSYLQTLYEAPLAPATDLQVTYMDFGSGKARKIVPNLWTNSWSSPVDWTTVTPPGNGTAPVILAPHTYVQWNGNFLHLTTDGGASWTSIATLPANPVNPSATLRINGFGSSQVTSTSAGPALYEYVTDGRSSGLVFRARLTPSSGTTLPSMEIRTFAGKNNLGFSSGLGGIYGNCFGFAAFYCQPVYAVDPKDYRNLIAADPVQKTMSKSTDAGRSWSADLALTKLVTANGTLSFTDSIGGCQAHVIAYDPGNPNHILVGTDQAGIIASPNGGRTWVSVPGTDKATAISSIFFDDRTNVVYVATYGRGLWKLTLNWNTF